MPLSLWLLFTLFAIAFIRTVLAVVGARLHIHTARHDLIVETKTTRIAYLHELHRREQETLHAHGVDLEDEQDPPNHDTAAAADTDTEPLASIAPDSDPPVQQAA